LIAAERPLAYLVALDLAGRHCVVIGGGEIASRRVGQLLDAGARVTVVAEHLDAAVAACAARGDVAWVRRAYRTGDVVGAASATTPVAPMCFSTPMTVPTPVISPAPRWYAAGVCRSPSPPLATVRTWPPPCAGGSSLCSARSGAPSCQWSRRFGAASVAGARRARTSSAPTVS
jgi:hypothetical protein